MSKKIYPGIHMPIGEADFGTLGPPTFLENESRPPEEIVKEVAQYLQQTLSDNFVGRCDTPQLQDEMRKMIARGMHTVGQADALPPGVKIENVRLENDTILMDVTLPPPPFGITLDFVLKEETGIKAERIGNMVRISAPWKF